MFKGYCFPVPGDGEWHTPAVMLNDAEEVFRYTQLQSKLFREVRVVDGDDFIVVQMIDQQYTFPEGWKKFNRVREDNENGNKIQSINLAEFQKPQGSCS